MDADRLGLVRDALFTQPELNNQGVDRKADPEGPAKELAGLEMGKTAGGEKYAHNRPGGGDAQKNHDRPKQPSPLEGVFAATPKPVGTKQREQKKGVEEQHCRPLYPSADRIHAHGIGGQSDYQAEREQQALRPNCLGRLPENHKRRNQHKGQGRQNVRQRQRHMRREEGVERR